MDLKPQENERVVSPLKDWLLLVRGTSWFQTFGYVSCVLLLVLVFGF